MKRAPELHCEPNNLSVTFKSVRPFTGRIFVKGYANHNECVQYGSKGVNHQFTVLFDQCGVRRYREKILLPGQLQLFITKVDRAYHLRCFYMEASKTLSQRMDVRYEIVTGGPTGVPIQFVRVGDIVYHKWSCTSESSNLYCMKVHSCIVYDGQGGQSVELIDKDGCAVDPTVLQDLDYLGDLMAGQRASVFKFADRSALYFSCQIELLIKDPYGQCSSAVNFTYFLYNYYSKVTQYNFQRPLCKTAESSVPVAATSDDVEQTMEEEFVYKQI
uniref:ZP domain-containing protein n=1 Tax=Syphacia muris TaxID=451379 RepID=A0A0N5AZ39_9BILA